MHKYLWGLWLCLWFALPVFAQETQVSPAPSPVAISSTAPTVAPSALPSDTASSAPEPSESPSATPQEKPSISASENQKIEEKRGQAKVTYLGEELFYIYTDSSVYTAQQRADIITQRIDQFAQTLEAHPLKIKHHHQLAYIVADNETIMTITQKDADAVNSSPSQLASFYAKKLEAAVAKGQMHYNFQSLMISTLTAIAITLVLLIMIFGIFRLFPKIHARIEQLRLKLLPDIRIRDLVLVPSQKIADFTLFLLKFLRTVLVLFLMYFYFPLIFSLFPWTRNWAPVFISYFTTPLNKAWLAFTGYIPNLFVIVVIIAITYYLLKLVKLLFFAMEFEIISYPGFHKDWAKPTYSIVRFLIMAFVAVVIFPYLPGSNSPAFQSISLFLGVLFSLGSTSAIANIVAGVVLTYMRPFREGDRVKISDTMGNIIEKNLLVTRIRTVKNVDITIPNSMVLNSHMINYSSSAEKEGLILHTTVTIGYDVPWPQVHELLIKCALMTEYILQEPKPFVLQTSLDDFYVSYELNAYTQRPNFMAKIYSEIHSHIQDEFHAAGIEIMSPHFSGVRDANMVNIPAEHLPKDYQAPSFRLPFLPPEPPSHASEP